MRDEPRRHPDLLRRFVPTPYVFSRGDCRSGFYIESNDLEIALCVRQSSVVHSMGGVGGRMRYKLIRDMAGPVDSSEISMISDGMLRVLYVGRGTILIHDRERSELLGFVSRNVKPRDLASSLIPALLAI
jgi:hypothetical protein